MKQRTAVHIGKVRETIEKVDHILGRQKYSEDLRTVAVFGLVTAVMQHCRSIVDLMTSGAVRSAGALTRATVEATYCGLWVNSCADAGLLKKAKSEERLPLSLAVIIKTVDGAYNTNSFFERVRKQIALLYRYNRSGVLQLGRWSLGLTGNLENDEHEMCDVMSLALLCVLLLAADFLAKRRHVAESKAVQALGEVYLTRS